MQNKTFQHLYQLARQELTQNLMPWWMNHTPDEETGYFHAVVRNDNTPPRGQTTLLC